MTSTQLLLSYDLISKINSHPDGLTDHPSLLFTIKFERKWDTEIPFCYCWYFVVVDAVVRRHKRVRKFTRFFTIYVTFILSIRRENPLHQGASTVSLKVTFRTMTSNLFPHKHTSLIRTHPPSVGDVYRLFIRLQLSGYTTDRRTFSVSTKEGSS